MLAAAVEGVLGEDEVVVAVVEVVSHLGVGGFVELEKVLVLVDSIVGSFGPEYWMNSNGFGRKKDVLLEKEKSFA